MGSEQLVPRFLVLSTLRGKSQNIVVQFEVQFVVMADKSTELRRNIVKKTEDARSLKEKRRLENVRTKHENRFAYMFYKRTKVEFEDVQSHVITVDEVVSLSRKIKKKSDDREDELKTLMRAFAIGPSHVSAFLAENDAFRAIVRHLTGNDSKLQIYAAYCITNITAHAEMSFRNVVKSCAPYLIIYLTSCNNIMQDLCACALGNIAAYSKEGRELLITQGILKPLVDLLQVKILYYFWHNYSSHDTDFEG